jgi:hypothetical protein
VRSVGPAAGASLWSWSLLNGRTFPLDYHFVFLLLAILSFTAWVQTYHMQKLIEQPSDQRPRSSSLTIENPFGQA